ncbi:MAG: rhodanese-like domain-containing protein [Acidobacteriota bacterium]
MRNLSTEELRDMRERNEDFLLINVLSEDSFDEGHIPGSINIPLERKDFLRQVRQRAGSKNKEIVVYCSDRDCTASPTAWKKLEADGFRNVYRYEGGMKGWREAKLPVQQAAHSSR